jgi:hypothetical protein
MPGTEFTWTFRLPPGDVPISIPGMQAGAEVTVESVEVTVKGHVRTGKECR